MAGRPKGHPKTGGRKKGTPNKYPSDIRKLAQAHGEEAINVLVEIMQSTSAPESSRVSAAEKLIERGYGRVPQPIGGADELPPIKCRIDYSRISLGARCEILKLMDESIPAD